MNEDEPNVPGASLTCEEVRDLLYLYSCDELQADEKAQVDKHLNQCEACRNALGEHQVLKGALHRGFSMRNLPYYSRNN